MPSPRTIKCKDCPGFINREARGGRCLACYKAYRHAEADRAHAAQIAPTLAPEPVVLIEADRKAQREAQKLSILTTKYHELLKVTERQEADLHSFNVMADHAEAYPIGLPKTDRARTNEGTVVLVASDWHIEEGVGKEVGGLNTYSIEIAEARAQKFFQAGLRLTNLLAQDLPIRTMVLALLGDFISNDIHEEFPEINELSPTHAIVMAQNMIISGITFLLEQSDLNLVIPCHSGNHARTTRTTRFSAENGHSLEYLMYLHLATYFRSEPRVTFIIPEGMHSYLDIYGTTVRFQHGHAIKYGGGVGGIYIPVNKAIGQWNKARHADLDVFGHFHQLRDGGNFICNGSLIGYNAFALSIKADFDKPKQALFLMDRKRGRTCTWPILVDAGVPKQ